MIFRFPATSLRAVALLFALASPGWLQPQTTVAQEPTPADSIHGRVLKDGLAVPRTPVTLHRVTPNQSGEVASALTDQSGAFSFALEQLPDVGFNVFFVTAEHLSVRYFGEPIHLDEPQADYAVEVFDTTSVPAAPVRINRRDMVMIPLQNDAWEVNEIISILNSDSRALVSDRGMPTMEISVPGTASNFQAGEGDIFPHEVSFMDGRILLVTPVLPGRRDLFIRYLLPAEPSDVTVPLDQPTDTLNLYVQQPSHLTSVEGLSSTQMIDVEGEQFLQYSATEIAQGNAVLLAWTGGLPVDPVLLSVGITLALLAVGAFLAVRNRNATTLA